MADLTAALTHVLTSSQQLTTWALAVGGGSIALIVGASYRRPRSVWWRVTFLLFVPGWICLAMSLHRGTQLSRSFLAYTMVPMGRAEPIGSKINDLYSSQGAFLSWSVVFFSAWLVIYLLGWIFVKEFEAS